MDFRYERAQRSKINFIGFGIDGEVDSDSTYPAKLSCCTCPNRQVLTKKGVLKCPGCGQETMTEEQAQKEDKLKSKHGKRGKNKPFVYSYDPRKKATTLYEGDCREYYSRVRHNGSEWGERGDD